MMHAALGAVLDHEGPALLRVLLLSDYNTRVVVIGTALLGMAAGLAGTFLTLRKRALLGDAVAHATLPGVVVAWMLSVAAGGDGRALLPLLAGAAIFGVLGMMAIILIRRFSRLKDDAALGIVLSVFFGVGVSLLGVATKMGAGNAAGLSSFIYGKTASMLLSDAIAIGALAVLVALCVGLFYHPLKLLCFDAGFAAAQGWPVMRLDFLLMSLVVAATVIGLQSVGLILVVALLVIPPAAARCWSHRLSRVLVLSGIIGAISCYLGASISALASDLPAGAIIVLVASMLFVLSFLLGRERGLLWRWLAIRRSERSIGLQHLLRAMFELQEAAASGADFPHAELERARAWRPGELNRMLAKAEGEDLVASTPGGWRLTATGQRAAAAVVRNHRLWELFLIRHADTAPSKVDQRADLIEHVLDADLVAELERELDARPAVLDLVPASPHRQEVKP